MLFRQVRPTLRELRVWLVASNRTHQKDANRMSITMSSESGTTCIWGTLYPHYLSCHPLCSQGLSLVKHSPEMIKLMLWHAIKDWQQKNRLLQSKSKMCHGNYSVRPVFFNPLDKVTH